MVKGRATKSMERTSPYNEDGLISRMYRRSGGCDVKHRCGECIYYQESLEVRNGVICGLHESNLLWKKSWMACKFWESRGRRKSVKIREEGNKQLRFDEE